MLPGVYLPSQNRAASSLRQPASTASQASQASTARPAQVSALLQILKFYIYDANHEDNDKKYFHTPMAFLDVSFTGQRPIIGEGHHFTVFASPYHKDDKPPPRCKRYNPEVYCIKFPNPSRRHLPGFRQELHETVLREMQVLCHPRLQEHPNVIGLLAVDFHEDANENLVAWPCLLLELSDYGTLDMFQYDQGQLSQALALDFLSDIALDYKASTSVTSCMVI